MLEALKRLNGETIHPPKRDKERAIRSADAASSAGRPTIKGLCGLVSVGGGRTASSTFALRSAAFSIRPARSGSLVDLANFKSHASWRVR
jgi:hypothetical protein